ncbi:hypothetical protein BC827DRAFT_1249209 [Russula dissimulans]|nr:hypothetical protein BC827DRAFT_1249209 [Russula dissimulans]
MTVWYVNVISYVSITCYVSAVCIQSRRVPSCFGRSILVFYLLLWYLTKSGKTTYSIYIWRTLTKPVAYLYL